jgi:hypothetical protein
MGVQGLGSRFLIPLVACQTVLAAAANSKAASVSLLRPQQSARLVPQTPRSSGGTKTKGPCYQRGTTLVGVVILTKLFRCNLLGR